MLRTLKTETGIRNNPTVEAPCCGRFVPADMLVYIAELPANQRTTKKKPLEYACDACRERLVNTKKVKRSDLAKAAGADASKVKQLKAKEA